MRYSGVVGFIEKEIETEPGVFTTGYREHHVTGTLLSSSQNNRNNSSINNELSISNRLSIVADRYTYQNMRNIRYVSFMGETYYVTSITELRPRLTLEMGDVFIKDEIHILTDDEEV